MPGICCIMMFVISLKCNYNDMPNRRITDRVFINSRCDIYKENCYKLQWGGQSKHTSFSDRFCTMRYNQLCSPACMKRNTGLPVLTIVPMQPIYESTLSVLG